MTKSDVDTVVIRLLLEAGICQRYAWLKRPGSIPAFSCEIMIEWCLIRLADISNVKNLKEIKI